MRINHDPRTIKEIAQYFELEEKKITKGNKQFKKILKNADDNETIINSTMNNSAEDFIKRYCTKSKLKLSKEEFETSLRIANNCCRMKLAKQYVMPDEYVLLSVETLEYY